MADMELEYWKREMRRRPEISSDLPIPEYNSGPGGRSKKNLTTNRHGYRTRATGGDEQDDEEVFDVSSLIILPLIYLCNSNYCVSFSHLISAESRRYGKFRDKQRIFFE